MSATRSRQSPMLFNSGKGCGAYYKVRCLDHGICIPVFASSHTPCRPLRRLSRRPLLTAVSSASATDKGDRGSDLHRASKIRRCALRLLRPAAATACAGEAKIDARRRNTHAQGPQSAG
jgi:hypothetical protein